MATPEASAAYLERFNFKTLMEWLTARVILHRPDDPMVFCRDLLETNIEERGGKNIPFDPACAPHLLKGCYDDAMNAADEHGVIHPEACRHPITGNKRASVPEGRSNSNGSNSSSNNNNCGENRRAPENDRSVSKTTTTKNELSLATATAAAVEESESLPVANGDAMVEQSATARISPSPVVVAGKAIPPRFLSVLQDMCELARPEIAASVIVAGACKAVNARRGSLFKVTNEAGELREIGAGPSSTQRVVKPGQGLVGNAAAAGTAGVAVVVVDPSKEGAFCQEVDVPRAMEGKAEPTGERSPALMYGPVKDGFGGTWGVLVVAEPANDDAFSEDSLHMFRAISVMASLSIRNSEVFGLGQRGCDKFRNMVEVIEATNDRLGVNHLLYTIAKCLPIICDAQKCTCFLVDDDRDELWVVQGELNMRVPKSKGIVGAVATSGNAENISDVYADPRFNKEVDVETGFQTHSILAMPVRGGDKNKVIAVVQLINKQEEGGTDPSATGSYDPAAGQHFTAQDEVVIGAFLSLLGPHIFTSSISQFSRKVLIKVNTIGNEEIAFPEDRHMSMQPRQKSMGSLADVIDAEQSLQEEEEDYDEDVDGGENLGSADSNSQET